MTTPEDIQTWIQANLQAQQVTVTGDGRHFEALVVSDAFSGQSTMARHRLVYAALGDKMREAIHALSLKTLTPDEFNQ